MSEALKNHIARFVQINEEDYLKILPHFKTIEISHKENLLVEGKICTNNYFVSQGCLRLFSINEKGLEHTIQFALENWWLSDYTSFSSQTPSEYYIQAVEKSVILALDHNAQEELLQQFPALESYFRKIHQRAHAASQFRIKSLYLHSKEELYHLFINRHPEFVQRIPQYLLASFLGFTPEYLSEIRKKNRS